MRRALTLALMTLVPALATAGQGKDQLIEKVFVRPVPSRKVEVALYRTSKGDGSLAIRLSAKAGKLVIYSGGGEDDGPSDQDYRDLSFEAVDLAPKTQLLRVNFTYRPPDGKPDDVQIDTYLVSLEDKPKLLLEVTTKRSVQKSKLCKVGQKTTLAMSGVGKELIVTAKTAAEAEPTLGDDDTPIDKSCTAKGGSTEKTYKMVGGVLRADE